MPGARVSFAEQQAAAKRALNPQVRADALRLVTERNERQAQRAPLLFSLTIGAATAAQHCCCSLATPAGREGCYSRLLSAGVFWN